MSWNNYRGGGGSRSQDQWGQDSWQQQDSSNQWGNDSWQQDDRQNEDSWGSGWGAGHQEEQKADPWAKYKGGASQGGNWDSDSHNRRGGQDRGRQHEEDDSWGGNRGNQRGRGQDSWGTSNGRSNHQDNSNSWSNSHQQEDPWAKEDPWGKYKQNRLEDNGRQQEDGWGNSWDRGGGHGQDNHWQKDRGQGSNRDWQSSHKQGNQDSWGNSDWNQDSRHSGHHDDPPWNSQDTQQQDSWSNWDKPQRKEESGRSGNWNRRNRDTQRDQDSWGQENSGGWDNWQDSSHQDGQDSWGGGGGWGAEGGGGGGSKASDWDGVNQWTSYLTENPVDWTERAQINIKKDFYAEVGHETAKNRTPDEIATMRQLCGIEILQGDNEEHPIPGLIDNFEEACWTQELLQALQEDGFEGPTPIQKQIWPCAMQGRDVVGIAETGSGKTVSYVLPMITHISFQEELQPGDGPVGLVLAPTRELARQIQQVCERYGSQKGLKSSTVVGGTPSQAQKEMLQERNDILVATPGRLQHALGEDWTKLSRVTFVVLDEADELLDKYGFGSDIRAILSQVRVERQILMFSATWPEAVQELAQEICTASEGQPPVYVRIGGSRLAACKSIVQHAEIVENDEAKYERLKEKLTEMDVFHSEDNKCIIFCRTRQGVIDLYEKLYSEEMCWDQEYNCKVDRLHAELKQVERDDAMRAFKEETLPCVISTGVLARGHDIPKVKYVINYDLPKTGEDYIHRVGRTGRAGHTGYAFTFINQADKKDLQRGHDYLLKVLEATEQQVDQTVKEAIEYHAQQAAWKQDAWEAAGDWNTDWNTANEVYTTSLEEFDETAFGQEEVFAARKLMGGWVEGDWHHNKKSYVKVKATGDDPDMYLYFWDDESVEATGWYFSETLGGDTASFYSTAAAAGSMEPPEGGWCWCNGDLAGVFQALKLRPVHKEAESWGVADPQATAQTSTEEYWEGANAADVVQEGPAQTSTEAYSAHAAPKDAGSTLNANAKEFVQASPGMYDWSQAQGAYTTELQPQTEVSSWQENTDWQQGDQTLAAVDASGIYYDPGQAYQYGDQAGWNGHGEGQDTWTGADVEYYEPEANAARPPPGLEAERTTRTGLVELDADEVDMDDAGPFVLDSDDIGQQEVEVALEEVSAVVASQPDKVSDWFTTGEKAEGSEDQAIPENCEVYSMDKNPKNKMETTQEEAAEGTSADTEPQELRVLSSLLGKQDAKAAPAEPKAEPDSPKLPEVCTLEPEKACESTADEAPQPTPAAVSQAEEPQARDAEPKAAEPEPMEVEPTEATEPEAVDAAEPQAEKEESLKFESDPEQDSGQESPVKEDGGEQSPPPKDGGEQSPAAKEAGQACDLSEQVADAGAEGIAAEAVRPMQ